MQKLVVWDMDDTLYPERDYVLSGFSAVASHIESMNIGVLADEIFNVLAAGFTAGIRKDSFNRLFDVFPGLQNKININDMVDIYRKHSPRIELLSEAMQIIKSLKADLNVRQGLLSDGFLIAQQQKVASLGLHKYIDKIILTDEYGRDFWKPNEHCFKELQAWADAPAHNCIYIADNPIKDFIAPNILGWHCVRIRQPWQMHCMDKPSEENMQAEHTAEDYSALEYVLEKFLKYD